MSIKSKITEFRGKLLLIITLVISTYTIHGKEIWSDGFDTLRSKIEWQQTHNGEPTDKIFKLTDRIFQSGRACAMIMGDRNRGIFQKLYIERNLPKNNGGVLTVMVYDAGYDYGGIISTVKVTNQKGQPVSFMLACGHYELCANHQLLRSPFLYRRIPFQWYRIQFVLDPKRDKGRIKLYVDGRLASISRTTGNTSFKSITLGGQSVIGKTFYDSISLNDDPNAINVFKGIDLMMQMPSSRIGNVVYEDDPDIPVAFLYRNYSGKSLTTTIKGQIMDADGNVLESIAPQNLSMNADDKADGFEVRFPVPNKKGRLYLELSAYDGKKKIGQTRIPICVTFNPILARKYDTPFAIQIPGSMRRREMKNIGARTYNLGISWNKIETVKGTYKWDANPRGFDKKLGYTVNDPWGIIMGHFRECPKWAWAGKGWNHCVPKNNADLENFARTVARRYRGRVNYWSYWEEPDGYLPWPRYFELMKAAWKGYKAGNPQMKMVGLNGTANSYPFVEAMFKMGAGKYMDIYGHHFYVNGRPEEGYDFVKRLKMIHGFMKKYNNGKIIPMWDTECGLYVAGLGKGQIPLTTKQVDQYKANGWLSSWYCSDSDAANFTVRKILLGYANGVDKFFFHKSLRHYDDSYSLVALAVSALCHELSGSKFVRKIDLGRDNLHGYLFEREKRYFAALWTTRETADISLELNSDIYEKMDCLGNISRDKTAKGGLLSLRISESPIYLLNVSNKICMRPGNLILGIPKPVLRPTFKIMIKTSDKATEQLKGTLTLRLPKGWTAKPATINFDSQKKENPEFTVTVPHDLYKGKFIVSVQLSDAKGKLLFSCQDQLILSVAAPCRQVPKGIDIDGDFSDWPTDIPVMKVNRLDQVVLGRPAVEDTYTLSQQVKSGSRFWKGTDDFQADVRTAWDDKYFYVGIEVKDDKIMNDFMKNPYKGDSIEMFLDTRGDKGLGKPMYTDGVYHLRFVPPVGEKKEGRQVGYFTMGEDPHLKRRPEFIIRSGEKVYSDGEKHLKNKKIPLYASIIQFSYKLTQEGYTVEFAIPFSNFLCGRPKVDEVFGFNLMFNDQDFPKEPRAALLSWYGTLKNSNNPSVFGKLRLVGN